ncbi:MAG: 2OG-Fe(II) oxygenase family protein [Myxococcaceae bacterium]
MQALGLVDYSKPDAQRQFSDSLLQTGFAILINHPISQRLISSTYQDWAAFFASESRWDYLFSTQTQMGYVPPNKSETAKGYGLKDLKEFYNVRDISLCPMYTQEHTRELRSEMLKLADILLDWIEGEMPGVAREKLVSSLKDMVLESQEHLLRPIHYPPLTGHEAERAVRSAAHEDMNLITLLPAGTAPGLQVKDLKGVWHEVNCGPGDMIINTAEMLQIATAGYYKATTHQVVNPSGDAAHRYRYSMPFFMHPRKDAYLTHARTADDFLKDRLIELGLF